MENLKKIKRRKGKENQTAHWNGQTFGERIGKKQTIIHYYLFAYENPCGTLREAPRYELLCVLWLETPLKTILIRVKNYLAVIGVDSRTF